MLKRLFQGLQKVVLVLALLLALGRVLVRRQLFLHQQHPWTSMLGARAPLAGQR